MCGIFGSPRITPDVHLMLPYLAVRMEARGTDSWGASNGQETIKNLGAITSSWKERASTIAGWIGQPGIFHTRASSVGSSKSVENAHPFTTTSPAGMRYVGIHNGHFTNHTELNTKYNRQCEVDSMHLWHHIAEGRDWADIQGWANVAWLQAQAGEPWQLHVYHSNSSSLAVARLASGSHVFASTREAIELAAGMTGAEIVSFYSVDEDKDHWFQTSAEGVETFCVGERIPFGHRIQVVSAADTHEHTGGGATSYTQFYGGRTYRGSSCASGGAGPTSGNLCRVCVKVRLPHDKVVCKSCLDTLFVRMHEDQRDYAAGSGSLGAFA